MRLDQEARALEAPQAHKAELRLWLRLLTCSTMIEREVRARLRAQFGFTLPRFDVLAQLDKAANGMALSELSKRMMVSNGNVTGLVESLAAAGYVRRRAAANDRRAQIVSLTPYGRRAFREMARAHEAWIADLLDGVSARETDDLMRLLGRVKARVGAAIEESER